MRWATYASVSVASVLIFGKFYAWMVTDSVSLLSTLIDSVLDAAASLINLLAVHHALQPADREHRFGHGKAEALAGLAQSAFITGSAVFLLIEAVQRLLNPKAITGTEAGYFVMGVSIVLTIALVVFQRFVIKRSGSLAISADSLHYESDLLINASVILSLFLASHFNWPLADPLFAIAIAAYIIRTAWQIGDGAFQILMDRELPDEDRLKIRSIVMAQPGVLGMHDLRTRSSGTQAFIQLHLELDGELKLKDAHIISDRVELEVANAFPNAEVIVHEDPDGVDESQVTFR
ncbi:MAG: cation diffusion facilitator family transporter [Rhodospirillales bacterium]|nr:cation diffusion facilitator family transporter [Rhodospirillales bacterium]